VGGSSGGTVDSGAQIVLEAQKMTDLKYYGMPDHVPVSLLTLK